MRDSEIEPKPDPKPAACVAQAWLAVAWCLAAAGCGGSGLDLAEATGVVTVAGTPLDRVGVVFHPSLGPIATANTDAEGRFRLKTANQDGALVGDHVVTITESAARSVRPAEGGLVGAPVADRSKPKRRFAAEYSRSGSSLLRATVERSGPNHFTFELEAGGASR